MNKDIAAIKADWADKKFFEGGEIAADLLMIALGAVSVEEQEATVFLQ
jgi:hypothetical protein